MECAASDSPVGPTMSPFRHVYEKLLSYVQHVLIDCTQRGCSSSYETYFEI